MVLPFIFKLTHFQISSTSSYLCKIMLHTIINTSLPVMEAFYTLQGEGFHQGKAAYFIRLGGCDVGCTWCDVKESWDAAAHPKVLIKDIVDGASMHPGRLAVVTG